MAVRVTAQYIQYATTGNRVGLRVAGQNVEVAGTVDLNPDIRVAAQNVEVAGDVALDNAVRITAQIVEVVRANDHRGLTGIIGTIGSGLSTETLQLGAGSQGASFCDPVNTGVVGSRNSLAGAHLVPGRVITAQKFSNSTNAISLTQSVTPGLAVLFANNTISLTDDSDSSKFSLDANNTISVSDIADVHSSILSLEASNTISGLTVSTDNNFFVVSASNTLALTQSETVTGPILLSADSPITIIDTATVLFNVFGRTADNTVEFFGFNPDAIPASPALGWDTVISSIRNLTAETPDKAGDLPESGFDGFMDGWTQAARLTDTFEESVSNTITLTDFTPQPTGKRSVSADSPLSLLVFADHQIKDRIVVENIVLVQTATFEKVFNAVNTITLTIAVEEGFVNLFASNTIELEHIGRPNPRTREGINTLALTDVADSSIKNLFASNAIVFTQDINVLRPHRVEAENIVQGTTDDVFLPPFGPIIPGVAFGLSDEATLQINASRNVPVLINIADLAQVVHILVDAVDLTATTVIGLVQVVNLSETADALTVIDTLVVVTDFDKNTSDVDTLIDGLTDTALLSVGRTNLLGDNVLALKHAVGYSLVRDTTNCDYTPFVGVSDADTQPPSPLLPVAKVPPLDPSIRFRLVYPPFDVGAAIDTLDLRAPNLGNRERLEATRISRETVGGTLTVFADPIWPKVHSLQLQFQALKTTQARELLDFMERWLGLEIGIYDYEGRIWRGVITNPDEAVTQDGKESYSANLDIEAERVHDEVHDSVILSTLSLSQTAEAVFTLDKSASPVDIAVSTDYTKFPVGAGSNTISPTQFATRNSFFFESANSPISLGHIAAELDFNDFGNLIHNWDAENTPGGSGSALSSWDDLGSTPVTLNATVSQEPTVRDSILNGRRVVEFRHSVATQRLISASNIPLFDLTNKIGTIFIVTIIREALTGGNEIIIGNNVDKLMLGGTTSTQRPVALLTDEGVAALETPQSVLGNGTTQLLMLRRNGNDLTFRRNKTTEDGLTFATNPDPGNEQLYFGGFSGAGNSVDQDIAQVLFYDDVLSDEDIVTIEGLLAAKWGV